MPKGKKQGVSAKRSGRPSGLSLAMLGALGGTALAFLGQVAFDQYQSWKAAHISASDRKERGEELMKEYYDLEETPLHAQSFIDTGGNGSPDDVRKMYLHFRKVVFDLWNDRVRAEDVVRNYGGSLRGWAERFELLSSGAADVSINFDKVERRNFGYLSSALNKIAAAMPELTPASDELENVVYSGNATAAPVFADPPVADENSQ